MRSELREFRSRFGIPISDEQLAETPFYLPPEDSREIQYLRARRQSGRVTCLRARCDPNLWLPTTTRFSVNSSRAAMAEKFRPPWLSSECCARCYETLKSGRW